MTDKLNAALSLAQQGHRVFPLAINGKVPALDGNWQKLASTDPERIRALWTCPVFGDPIDYNVGIAIGPHTVVIDVDVRDGKRGAESLRLWEAINGDLPATYEVTTASGGRHLYFTDERSGQFPKELCEHVDIKQFGGYVVGPGSEIDGRFYTRSRTLQQPDSGTGTDQGPNGSLDGQCDLAPLPDSVRPSTSGHSNTRGSQDPASVRTPLAAPDSASAIARATEWLQRSAPDHGTYAVACRLKDFGVSQDTATELMLEHWPPGAGKGEEHVSFRVGNAFRYGQNAPGVSSAEAEFEAVEIDQKLAPKRRGLYVDRWNTAEPDVDRPYLVEDVADAGSMIVTYGASNTGKSYVALDMAFRVARGEPWIGRKTKQGLVVYVAAEGREGFKRRIAAYKKHYGAPDIPFALVPCPIDLQSDKADTKALIRLVQEEEAHYGQKCVLVVIDTLARAMAGGDENTATDMGRFVGHCDRITEATNAAVHVIHHTGKDASRGARGSSALRAATDTELEVAGGAMTVAKQRDMGFVKPEHFKLTALEIGHRADGKAVTACVVEWRPVGEFEVRVSEMARAFHKVLFDRPDKTDTWKGWIEASKAVLKTIHNTPPGDDYFRKLKGELVNAGAIEETKRGQWLALEV